MELKTIVAIVLVVVIVGGFVFLQIKNRKSNLIVCGAELNSAPFIRSDIDGATKTVESRVLSVLKDCPRARFDDMMLLCITMTDMRTIFALANFHSMT